MNLAATMRVLDRRARIILVVALIGSVLTAILQMVGADHLLIFASAAISMAALAAAVGESTDQLGSRLGPGATGVLQSALGNLPELFIAIFALQAGLVQVVQAALVGSILG